MLLRNLGVTTVIESADDMEAADFCREHRPEVALVDFDLPGISVAARVLPFRSKAPDVAMIAVSVRIEQAAIDEFSAAGVLGNIPIHRIREEVMQSIAASLDRFVGARSELKRTG